MAKHKTQIRWTGTPEHDKVVLEMMDKYPTNGKYAFEQASIAIKQRYGAKRTAGACENRYYTALSNPNSKENHLSTLPVVLTKKGQVHRGRRITPAPSHVGNLLTSTQMAFLKKITDRLSTDQKVQLAEMLVFES